MNNNPTNKIFQSKNQLRSFLHENASILNPYEAGALITTLGIMPEGRYSIEQVANEKVKKNNKNLDFDFQIDKSYIEDLDTKATISNLFLNNKSSINFQNKKWDALETLQSKKYDDYFLKNFETGYNLLNTALSTLEKDNHVCYNNCIHKLSANDSLPRIIEMLDILPKFNSSAPKKIDYNISKRVLPQIKPTAISPFATRKSLFDSFENKTINSIPVNKNASPSMSGIGKIYDFAQSSSDLLRKAAFKGFSGLTSTLSKLPEKSTIGDFARKINSDIENLKMNNTDMEKVVNSNFFSSYKGNIVLKLDPTFIDKALDMLNEKTGSSLKYSGTFSFGDTIVIRNDADKYPDLKRTLDHESGHGVQYDNLGPISFIKEVAIPSIKGAINYSSDNSEPDSYYLQPWENSADTLGNVEPRETLSSYDRTKIQKVGEEKSKWKKFWDMVDSWN